jgi:hypothetical protein
MKTSFQAGRSLAVAKYSAAGAHPCEVFSEAIRRLVELGLKAKSK